MPAGDAWNEREETTLNRLWLEGLSASQISKQLDGRSRNAVIGRIHRLGLAGRARINGANQNKIKGARLRTLPVKRTAPITKPLKAERLATDLAIIKALPALGADLGEATGCRFIPGDPAHDPRVCGRATTVGGVWCAQHARLVYVPSKPRAKVRSPESDERARWLRDLKQAGRAA